MKTIAVNNRSNMFKVLAVVGVLGAIYLLRRRGGSISGLIGQGKDLAGRVREQATEMYNNITESGEVEDAVAGAKEATQQIKSRVQSETSSVH